MAARFAPSWPLAALSSAPIEDLLAGSSIDVEAPLQAILITPMPS
jgi:hypothetical protein